MSPTLRRFLIGAAVVVADPGVAGAGMPTVTLTDVARMRVENISFFLAGLLLSSAAIQFLWNRLRGDVPILPRLSYGKALGVVVLWGLLFVLVLTMISGARELMTPGAWEKQGRTYRLTGSTAASIESAAPSRDQLRDQARRQKLEELRVALWGYADAHQGQFPPDRTSPAIPAEKWAVPDPSGMRYLYEAGQAAGRGHTPLAYEPELFGSRRFVLFTNGDIREMDSDAISQARRAEKK
jgi:hypothetical protein